MFATRVNPLDPEVRRMPRLLDPELHGWPIDDPARRAIVERRISMLGRTDWTGYPAGVPKLGRLGSTVTLFIVIPILCVVTLLILVLAGSPNAAYAFGLTFLAEGAIFAVIYRDRRRNLTRAAALETGHPVCLFCGYYNLGHHTRDSCCECGAAMPELPSERFPAPEEDETVLDMRRRRRRIPGIQFEKP